MMQKHSRAHIHATRTVGEAAADVIAAFVGSWRAVWIHAAWFAVWLLLRLDINLLTLVVSLEAIFLCIFLLMSQNRQSAKDRVRDDTEAAEVEQLFGINREQLEILQGLRDVRAILREHTELLAQLLPERPTMLELPVVPGVSGDGRPARDPQTGRYAKATTVAQAKGTETE